MNTNELTPNITLPEINDLAGLANGCNKAVVTYGLQEQFGRPNQYKMVKLVVLYCDTDLDTETVVGASSQIMMRNSVSLSKPFIFKVLDSFIKKATRDIKAVLFKNIFGFIPKDNNVHDCRHLYSQYQKGGYNGTI